jgi:hypothetical protein
MSIKKAIELLKNESFTIETIVPYLRELFDDYRSAGGEPKKWLSGMLMGISDNSHRYKPEIFEAIVIELTEWIEVQKKIGFDSLYHYTRQNKEYCEIPDKKQYKSDINLITQAEFEALYNERRRQQMPVGFFKKSWPLITTKVIKKRQDIYKADENGVPTLVERIPGVSKKAFNTNNFNALCQAVWQYYTGNVLKRISSEGKYRVGVGFIPSTNKGFADLHGMYKGRAVYIETKQRNEKHLKSQQDFMQWVRDGGGIYHTVRSFEDMYLVTQNILKEFSK